MVEALYKLVFHEKKNKGVDPLRVGVGSRFMRYTAVWKASTQ